MATLNLNEKKIPSAENLRLIAQLCISLANKQSSLEDRCIAPWKSGEVYQKDISYVSHGGYIYLCSVSNSDIDFVESHWTKLSDTISELTKADIEALVNLSPEEISKLSDLISTEIRLDKTFSSSDTYTRIQAAIDTAKEYTNNQLGKAVKPAYKVVSSTSEVTETGYFYLISNGTNYDMYVLSADGSVVSLGTSEVDLSNYYTKTETDSDFLKKTDATSTYATITTVDGKVDKTDIIDNLTSTDTNKPLSANQGKVLKDEVDKKAEIDDTQSSIATVYSSDKVDKITSNIEGISITKTQELDFNNLKPTENAKEKTFVHIYSSDMLNAPNNEVTHWIVKASIIDTEIRQTAMATHSSAVYVRSTTNGTDWTDWQRLCTTSVADVPLTNVPLDSSKFSSGNLRYEVKNGVCYVYITTLNAKSTFTSYELSSSPMPKPSSGLVTAPIVSDTNGANMGFFYVGESFNFIPRCHIFIASEYGYTTFSYPVAES